MPEETEVVPSKKKQPWNMIRDFAGDKNKFSCEELYSFLLSKGIGWNNWIDECQARKRINAWIVSNLSFVQKDIRKDGKVVKGFVRPGTERKYQKKLKDRAAHKV
jgi:hypothetical protein